MVYLLEDDDSIRKLVVYALESQGYQAKGFEKPSQFHAAMAELKPELVLLDIMLPEENGISVLRSLRSHPDTARLPIIMLTAKNTEYDRVEGLDVGADDYISKPFGIMELIARIRAVLRRLDDGSVLYDNDFPLPMANQADMPEVQLALEQGEGQGIRRSGSSGESTLYYAMRCADGTILRMGRSLWAVQRALLAVSPVLWILVLVLMISGVLAFRVASQIVKPINEMELDRPETNPYPELAPLMEKIQEQKLTILDEAEQRETMRREFSANVSHELKTPLTSISGFAELMAEGVVQGEKVQEFAGDIYRESQRLISLINDIIRLSQLDEENVEPAWESVDLYELAGSVLDSLRISAEKRKISMKLIGESAVVSGVYSLLSEMVYNLCDNAIKYNHPGGSVTVNVGNENGTAVLSVEDNGIGISPEHQRRVFERFYRVDKSHSREIGGTGLGLSIVKHGAQFHHAEVSLESEPGAGTRVALKFSADEKKKGTAEPSPFC